MMLNYSHNGWQQAQGMRNNTHFQRGSIIVHGQVLFQNAFVDFLSREQPVNNFFCDQSVLTSCNHMSCFNWGVEYPFKALKNGDSKFKKSQLSHKRFRKKENQIYCRKLFRYYLGIILRKSQQKSRLKWRKNMLTISNNSSFNCWSWIYRSQL